MGAVMIAFSKKIALCLLATLAFTHLANAQKVLYSGTVGKKTGIQVLTDTTSDNDTDYTDASYRTFKTYLLQRKLAPGAKDFYYRLKIRAPSTLISTSVDCSASPFLQSLLEDWFSFGKAALITINANVRYEPTTGENIDLVTNKAPVLMFSEGAQAGQLTTGHGCFLKEVIPTEFSPIRFDGGNVADGKDSFAVNLDISTGEKLDSKLISQALSLFGAASSAVFPWSATLTNNVAQTFDKAISDAGTFQSESPVNAILRPRSTLYIKVPLAFKKIVLEILPYLSASVILNQKEISPAGVLSSADLAQRTCTFQDVLAGNCKAQPVRIALINGQYIKLVTLPDKYQLPASVFDLEKPELILQLCQNVRLQLDDVWRLSTIDQMLVRWALTKESGLQKALADPAIAQKILTAVKTRTAAATLDDITTACWNAGDISVLSAVAGDKLKDN
jgi:hypothetical protein